METTKLSSKGQVVIPQSFRKAHGWNPGLELVVIEMEDGIFVKPKSAFKQTELSQVAGMLKDRVVPKTDAEIEVALKQTAKRAWRARR
jgi:AbrB family looped-hinge helix DNA binding protein